MDIFDESYRISTNIPDARTLIPVGSGDDNFFKLLTDGQFRSQELGSPENKGIGQRRALKNPSGKFSGYEDTAFFDNDQADPPQLEISKKICHDDGSVLRTSLIVLDKNTKRLKSFSIYNNQEDRTLLQINRQDNKVHVQRDFDQGERSQNTVVYDAITGKKEFQETTTREYGNKNAVNKETIHRIVFDKHGVEKEEVDEETVYTNHNPLEYETTTTTVELQNQPHTCRQKTVKLAAEKLHSTLTSEMVSYSSPIPENGKQLSKTIFTEQSEKKGKRGHKKTVITSRNTAYFTYQEMQDSLKEIKGLEIGHNYHYDDQLRISVVDIMINSEQTKKVMYSGYSHKTNCPRYKNITDVKTGIAEIYKRVNHDQEDENLEDPLCESPKWEISQVSKKWDLLP